MAAEEDLWTGRYSGKDLGPWLALWVLGLIGIGVFHYRLLRPEWQESAMLRYVYLAVAGLPLLWMLWIYITRKMFVKYRLTSHRIVRVSGLWRKKFDEVHLSEIDDILVSQKFIQRFLNVGRVTVISTQSANSRLELVAVEEPNKIRETIWIAVKTAP